MINYILYAILGVLVIYFLSGIRTVRQNTRGVVETFGKYTTVKQPGLIYIYPIFQRLISINVTEQMTHIEPQEIITKDNLNAKVDLVVYFKIKRDDKSLQNVLYEVRDVYSQLDVIARTTARNVIGTMEFKQVNSERNTLNTKLQGILIEETKNWGVDVLKVELKEIVPPGDVQDTMNSVIKAQNTKEAAVDLAVATETKADGQKKAAIKEAEGVRQAAILKAEAEKASSILVAEGQAKAFKLINDSFKGNAQKLKQYEITQASLQNNAKVVLTKDGINPQIILGDIPTRPSK